MNKISLKSLQKITLVIALMLICANVGYRFGQRAQKAPVSYSAEKQSVVNTSLPSGSDVDFSLFWTVWTKLEQKYVDRTKIDSQKMVYGAISGMVSSLGDPYTIFLPPKENSDFKQDLNGTFEGIGAQLGTKDDKIIVITPLKDNPAEKAGIRPGDWIIKVDGADTAGWTVPTTVTKIRGPKGSTVTLTITHEGEDKQLDIKVIRNTITVKSVELETRSAGTSDCKNNPSCPKVAYIKLTRFGDQTNDEWNTMAVAVRQQLENGTVKGLVLDLRSNPGGYLQSAIHIASEFIKTGMVVQQENSDGSRETYSVTRVGNLLNAPVTVLINKGSASAAEILSGALRDHKRATLVGETSFGKGSIQTPEDLPGGAGLHITTARWILPNGDQINGKGIKPDIEIKNATDSSQLDAQLEKGIETVLK